MAHIAMVTAWDQQMLILVVAGAYVFHNIISQEIEE